ncbi:MAG: TonB-dependent receptor plug domain-containing protein [Desulfobacterales bacterium]|nr:TonB-dependent receptor plug domain-containing protein [Desulfobacterales bacterium]
MKYQAKKRTGRGGVSCITRRKRSFNTPVIFFLLFAAVLLTVGTTSAQAMEMDFNIPAQTLSSALKTFAEETGLQMLYSSDAVKGIRSSRVKGRYQPKDALNILLGGTDLSFKFTDSNTVVVQKNKVGKSEMPEEKEKVKKPIVLEQMVVTATKSGMNVREVSASVNVVTSKEIELTPFADNMQQALRYVPGTYFSKYTAFGTPMLQVRGDFPAFLVNGREMAQLHGNYAGLHGGLMDMDAVERIEVIRGPQSAVHGSRAISGVINIITKKGDKENPYIKIHALAGTGDELRGGMSVSGGYEKFSYFITGSKMDQEDLETPYICAIWQARAC